MNKYEESLRILMKLFGEEVEEGMSYEHMHKVINDNLDNLKELIRKIPIEPLWDNNGYRKCGTCKLRLVSTNSQFINYCSNCGQLVYWNEEE